MKAKIYLFILNLCIAFSLSAQEKISFRSQNYLGLLEGESGPSVQLHSINGFQSGKWFAGIGAGLDYYYLKSVPLFFSVSRSVSIKAQQFYLAADAGINWPWQKSENNTWGSETFLPSLYYAGGFGYKLPLVKKNFLLLYAGYSYKHLIQEAEWIFPCFLPPCPESKRRYDFHLKRLSLKAGWMF